MTTDSIREAQLAHQLERVAEAIYRADKGGADMSDEQYWVRS